MQLTDVERKEQKPEMPTPEARQDVIFKALREVVQSDTFRRSARMIRFLEYVVLESLSATPRLTEKTIGIVVFDRPKEWDPKVDPIVRIEARRLREKLRQYYVSTPTEQAVVITLPKGGYKACFDWHTSLPEAVVASPKEDSEEIAPDDRPKMHNVDLAARQGYTSLWSRLSLWTLIFIFSICIGIATPILSGSPYQVMEDRKIQINTFRVDTRLNEQLDGTAIAGKIADQIRQLQHNTRATWTPPIVKDSWTSTRISSWSAKIKESLLALTIPSDGVYIREITGSVEDFGPDAVSLYVRGDNVEPKTFTGKRNDLPGLFLSAAEYIYGACQPSSYSVYLTEQGKSSEAISFTSMRYPKAQHLGDRMQLLYSWATALSQEGKHQEAIEKFKQTIAIAPQSWGSYIALQGEYEAIGRTEEAFETGRQLESRTHRGSWVFEHLPPRLFRHPRPDAFEATDELTNNYNSLKRSIELELKSQEGGAELLPLYASYAQVLARLHERSSAHLQLDLAVGRQDHGAAEGNLLYAKIILATEDQDNEQLSSILMSYRNKIKDPVTRSSLAIEADSACEIMTAYERAGDVAVSDLLSSVSDDSAECLSRKAEVQFLRGNIQQAYSLYQRAIADAPSLPSSHYEYGLFLLKQGDSETAKMQLQLAHTTGPYWAEPLESLAKLAMGQGDIKTSLNLYRQAAMCAPFWARLYVSWAEALVRDGKKEDALAKLQLASSMDLTSAEQEDLKRVSRSITVTNP